MDMEALVVNIAIALAPVLMAGLTYLATRLAALLSAKTKSVYVQGLMFRLAEAAMTVVKSLEQRLVADLKAAAADGRLTAEERNRIKVLAVAELRSYLGMKGLAQLMKVLGLNELEMSRLLATKLEAAVSDNKSGGLDPL